MLRTQSPYPCVSSRPGSQRKEKNKIKFVVRAHNHADNWFEQSPLGGNTRPRAHNHADNWFEQSPLRGNTRPRAHNHADNWFEQSPLGTVNVVLCCPHLDFVLFMPDMLFV